MTKFMITIETDNPDGAALVREATEMLACRLDWGDAHTTSVEATEARPFPSPPIYLAGYEMEPGDLNLPAEVVAAMEEYEFSPSTKERIRAAMAEGERLLTSDGIPEIPRRSPEVDGERA